MIYKSYNYKESEEKQLRYDKELMKRQAENLEAYLDMLDNLLIIERISKKDYEESVATVKKLIKHLKKGEGDKVYDKERYIEFLESGQM